MSIIRITEGEHITQIEGSWTVFTDEFEAYAGQFSHFTAKNGTLIGNPEKLPEEVSDNAYIPIITPINMGSEVFNDYEIIINDKEEWIFNKLIDENLRKQKSHEINFTTDSLGAIIKCKVEKGNSSANDTDGGNITVFYFSDDGDGKSVQSETHKDIKYGDTFLISWDRSKKIFQAQFYADDNDYKIFDGGVKNVYCGAAQIKGSKVGRRLTSNIEKLPMIYDWDYVAPPLFSDPEKSFAVANKYQNCLGMCFAVSMKRVEQAYIDACGITDAILVDSKGEDYVISGTVSKNIDDQFFGYGVGGTLAKNGYATLVSNEDVWAGALEEGAHIQYWANKNHKDWNTLIKAIKDHFSNVPNPDFSYGHSVIFKSYIYGSEGEIKGIKYYDYHGISNEPFLKSDEYTLPNIPKILLGANLKDNKL